MAKRKKPVCRAYEHDSIGTVIVPQTGGHWWRQLGATEWLDYTLGEVHTHEEIVASGWRELPATEANRLNAARKRAMGRKP